MDVIDIDLLKVKHKIEKIYGDNISKKSIGIGFATRKVDKWSSLSYESRTYIGPPNNDDVGKAYNEQFKTEMRVRDLEYRDVLGFHISIEQGDRILGEFPKGGIIRFDIDSEHIGLQSTNNGMHSCYWNVYTEYEYNISIKYIMSIIEANKKYMDFIFPHLLETKHLGGKLPKKWKRETTLDELLKK